VAEQTWLCNAFPPRRMRLSNPEPSGPSAPKGWAVSFVQINPEPTQSEICFVLQTMEPAHVTLAQTQSHGRSIQHVAG
jgi:hypothetical protein